MSTNNKWYPGKFLGNIIGKQLPLGYSVQQNPDLKEPYYIHNTNAGRGIISREALFSFPLAFAGFFVAGPVGVLVGHVAGATAGYLRNEQIQKAQ